MSTLALPYESRPTEQLYFSWAQPESWTSKNQPAQSRYRSRTEGPDRVKESGSASATVPAAKSASSAVDLPAVLNQPLTKSTRVGEVRLGSVMLALLKQYGITDEEIEAGLATISTAGTAAATVGQPVPG